jgi:uncharacterized membrane protein
VSLDDWALALHVLSAFSWVAGLIVFWVLVVAVRNVDTPGDTIRMQPMVRVGGIAVGVGALGTIALGIFLALSYGGYDLWDGWIIAAIVLWAAASAAGSRTGAEYNRGMQRAQELESAGRTGPDADLLALNRTSRGLLLHTVTSVLTLLIVIDMIWKPGA